MDVEKKIELNMTTPQAVTVIAVTIAACIAVVRFAHKCSI